MDNKTLEELKKVKEKEPEEAPNEYNSVHIQDHIKIYDPKSKEILINKR